LIKAPFGQLDLQACIVETGGWQEIWLLAGMRFLQLRLSSRDQGTVRSVSAACHGDRTPESSRKSRIRIKPVGAAFTGINRSEREIGVMRARFGAGGRHQFVLKATGTQPGTRAIQK